MAVRHGGGITYLDGNNLMGGAPPDEGRDARDRFLDELLKFRLPKPSCVVFDGPPPRRGNPSRTRGILRIIYAAPESADAVLRNRAGPGDTVVTSDFALQGSCRAAGARVLTGPEFLRSLRPLGGKTAEKPAGITESEVEAWMALFGEGREDP
jgi:hypothetical protein